MRRKPRRWGNAEVAAALWRGAASSPLRGTSRTRGTPPPARSSSTPHAKVWRGSVADSSLDLCHLEPRGPCPGERGKELHRCSVATTPRGAMAASDSRGRRGRQHRENSVTLRTGDYQIGPRQRWRAATPPSGDFVMPQRFSWMHPSCQVMISPDQVTKNSPVLGYRRTKGSLSLPCHGQEMVSVW
jgi:hypothetical protein